jgi:hypothetical protein
MKIRFVLMAVFATVLAAWTAFPAMADTVQLQCSTCWSGSVTQIAGGPVQFSFVDVANQTITGNAFVAILVPTGGGAPTFTGGSLVGTLSFTSGDLGKLLGQNFTGYNFSNFQSASSQQLGTKPSGFTVYEYSVGTGVTLGPKSTGISGLSASASQGSVIVGFIDPPSSTYETPLSGSITFPEPGTLGLLILGLAGLLGVSMLRVRKEGGVA